MKPVRKTEYLVKLVIFARIIALSSKLGLAQAANAKLAQQAKKRAWSVISVRTNVLMAKRKSAPGGNAMSAQLARSRILLAIDTATISVRMVRPELESTSNATSAQRARNPTRQKTGAMTRIQRRSEKGVSKHSKTRGTKQSLKAPSGSRELALWHKALASAICFQP